LGENGNGVCAPAQGAQELLQEFQLTGRQEPFEEIARRYAGMVYNVALQVTRDAHDAEDATQATFLTLAVHAKTAGKIRFVGPWLRKVSHRLALDIRRSKKRRRAREEKHANGNGHANGNSLPVSNDLHMEELRQILREELDKLPGKYRMPLILYYFGGLAPDEMSKELNCNTSTLGVRLHRGRKMLADSLSSRGISINGALLGALLAGLVDSFVTDTLVRTSTQAATHAAANGFALHVSAPLHLAELVRSATSALAWGRLKIAVGTALLIASSLAGGAEALRRLDVLNPSLLRDFNPMYWVRPLMDRLFNSPRLISQSQLPGQAHDALRDGRFAALDPAFALTLSATLPSPSHPSRFVSDPIGRVASTVVAVESQRTMASQLQLNLEAQHVAGATVVDLPAAPRQAAFSLSGAATPDPARTTSVTGAARLVIDRAHQNEVQSISSGMRRVAALVVGESTVGRFVHSGGTMHVSEALVIGREAGSVGTYSMTGGELLAAKLTVGERGEGHFVQADGEVRISTDAAGAARPGSGTPGILSIGDAPGSHGEYSLEGGSLYADTIFVGREGTGLLRQTGGLASFQLAELGSERIGDGMWSLTGGRIEVADAARPDSSAPALVVGGKGWGTFVLRSELDSAAISEQGGDAATIVVRADLNAQGVFRGYGQVGLSGQFIQNGMVIADGSGKTRVLDFATISSVTNSIENSADGGTNGFYARNGGRLVLPAIPVTAEGTFTWGEDPLDPVLDLVNSARLVPHNVTQPGMLRISLVDPQSTDVPNLPDGIEALSVWTLDSTAEFGSIDLMIRYDDVEAAMWGMTETDLTLWVYEGSWRPIQGQLTRDLANHLLGGTATNPTFFAAAPIPEPAAIALAAIAAGTLLRRRRRRLI
jgi:RNA polymerase sigma factor (sigma-70 family)